MHDIRQHTKDLDHIIDTQYRSWMNCPHKTMYDLHRKYTSVEQRFFNKYYNINDIIVKEKFSKVFPRYVRINYGFSIEEKE